jgi:Txe/YoeB family toxin of toxin-antitoxin system
VVTWTVVYTKRALKDQKQMRESPYAAKARSLIAILRKDPFETPPPFERLVGDLEGAYSRRITIRHRLVYQVIEESHTVKIISMWSHY